MKKFITTILITVMILALFPVSALASWSDGRPLFTIGFNTVVANAKLDTPMGSLPSIITIVSNPNNKAEYITVGEFLSRWPVDATKITAKDIYEKYEVGSSTTSTPLPADTPITTGMKLAMVDDKGKELDPYTFVVTGDLTGVYTEKFQQVAYDKLVAHLTKKKALTPLQAGAADLNQNQRVDIGDLAMMVDMLIQ